MTLLSLASKQIWPQILAFLHLNPRPDRLILFHTDEAQESAGPARRLRELFLSERLLPAGAVDLVRVPHDHFGEIVEAFANVAEGLSLDDSNCQVNLTGGNKLMALAAAEWVRLATVRCFYLERDLGVFAFLPRGGDFLPQESFKLDPHLARDLEPLPMLRCQLGDSEVVSPGQRLSLNAKGAALPQVEISALIRKNDDFEKFLSWDIRETKTTVGSALEFATAVALLKLGVPTVQRSIRLAPKLLRGTGREEGELDLVFNWAGKLWVVDCKDRLSPETRVDRLRTEILKQITPDKPLTELLNKLTEELRARDLHPLKEDLLAISEVGGLLGRAICVRRDPLPEQAEQFARSRKISLVIKDRLTRDLHPILFPNEPASLDQLRSLASARTRATV